MATRLPTVGFLTALVLVLGSQTGFPADVVHPDVVVHIERAEPTHRLIETSRVELAYGNSDDAIGFEPGGNEREAAGPISFAFDPQGTYVIADTVHRGIKRVEMRSGLPVVSPVRATELPSSSIESGARVIKCNPEAGLVTLPRGKKVQVEIGGPLASIRLIGTNAAGETFLLVERFLERGKLLVDRQIVVLDLNGVFKARLQLMDRSAIRLTREFVIGPDGALHRMVAGERGVSLVKWEVRR